MIGVTHCTEITYTAAHIDLADDPLTQSLRLIGRLHDFTYKLVTRYASERIVTFDQLQIRGANPCQTHLDQDLF